MSTKEQRVGVDCDNVLRETRQHIIMLANLHNPNGGYRLSDYDQLKGTDEVFKTVRKKFYEDPQGRLGCPPIPGALPATRLLRSYGFSPSVISVCDKAGQSASEQWLKNHGFHPYLESVIFGDSNDDTVLFKVTEATKLQTVVFFDDSPKNVIAVCEALDIPGYVIGLTDQVLPLSVQQTPTFLDAVHEFLQEFGLDYPHFDEGDLPHTVR